MDNLPKEFEVSFVRKEKVSADAYSFYFSRPAGLEFLPGQWMRIDLEIKNPDIRGNSRHFTITSSPTEQDHLMITTRIIQSSFKKTLEIIQPGTKVKIKAPYGKFVLDENEKQPHVFLAGGIGLTPFHSMTTYAVDKGLNIPITLFTSFKTADDTIFASLFRNIEAKHSWFKLIETVTRPEESKTPWTGLTGRIDADLIKKNANDLNNSLFYISGPSAMVDALAETVNSLNVPAEKIRTEKFTGY